MDYFNSCRVFDSQIFQWNEIAPMNIKRCYVSVAVLDGFIYAMVIFIIVKKNKTKTSFREDLMVIYDKIQRKDIHQFLINGFLFHQCMHNDQVCCFQVHFYTIIDYLKMHQQLFFKV
jgi:kelch-like protein 10